MSLIHMPQHTSPSPKLNRFERVIVRQASAHQTQFLGQTGTILWRDPTRAGHWAYVVYFPAANACHTFLEPDLASLAIVDDESLHLGTRAEISFDLLMDDDMPFIEGAYRTPGKFWQVLIFSKAAVASRQHASATWDSGITGTVFRVPHAEKLNRAYAIQALAETFNHSAWHEVRGPDSMALR